MQKSKIQWTTHTFNPWRGCTKISPGCAHCYAARDAVRFPGIRGIWGDAGTRVVAVPEKWKEPQRWNRKAAASKIRERVFCASLADVFEDFGGGLVYWAEKGAEGKPVMVQEGQVLGYGGAWRATMADARAQLFRLIEETPWLDWQLLTKRPENVLRMVPPSWREKFPDNVWMGVTVEDQMRADERIPLLLAVPAKVRFLSCEPLLGAVDLRCIYDRTKPKKQTSHSFDSLTCNVPPADDVWYKGAVINWVIAGGESGPKARAMHPEWVRGIRDQCRNADVPFFFKQWGEYAPSILGDTPMPDHLPDSAGYYFDSPHPPGKVWKFGKEAAGNVLDGKIWQEFPSL